MNILLIYPEFPDTFWSFRYALRFVRKKSISPPLGLLTIAAMLPAEWDKRLVDLNTRALADQDLAWADVVFISGMTVQRRSAREVLERCHAAGVKIVAGGPLFTIERELFESILFVDDNLIGNKRQLKTELLPALIAWRQDKPGITFQTEASINMADDEELLHLMRAAGFTGVFIGIETPAESGLAECSKKQNLKRDLVEDVKRIQRYGRQVQAGFIVGFDSDTPSIFQRQIDFIQKSGIVTAMVGLLQAPPGTGLYERLKGEGRLVAQSSGDNVDGTTNIIPAMNLDVLRDGYQYILQHIYAPRHYYQRVKTFLREYQPPHVVRAAPNSQQLLAFFRSIVRLGLIGKERVQYWNLFFWTLLYRPKLITLAVTLAIYGYHFRTVCELHSQA